MNKFTLTEAQANFVSSLKPNYTHICAYGGAGSGKTFTFIFLLILRAIQFPKSRHLIVRATRSSALASIIEEGFMLYEQFDIFEKIKYKINYTTLTIYFANGSVIRCLGCDHKKHFGRILGTRYSTIYLNECSELNPTLMFGSNGVITRLGQGKIYLTPEECEKYSVIDCRVQLDNIGNERRYIEPVNQVFYDFNPPTKVHWTYKYFIEKIHPVTGIKIDYKDKLFVAKINTVSNKHLAQDYEQTAKEQGTLAYQRFYEGDFQDVGGMYIQRDFFGSYNEEIQDIDFIRLFMTTDFAKSKNVKSDYNVLCVWGVDKERNLYLLDTDRFQAVSVDELPRLHRLYEHWKYGFNNGGAGLYNIYIEKPSNQDLIALLQRQYGNIINTDVMRSSNKFGRFSAVRSFIEMGKVFFPSGDLFIRNIKVSTWLDTYLTELESFTDDDKDYEHDDFCDNVFDACYIANVAKVRRPLNTNITVV